MDTYEREMINATTGADIRSQISDTHTLNVSAYNPEGYIILNE